MRRALDLDVVQAHLHAVLAHRPGGELDAIGTVIVVRGSRRVGYRGPERARLHVGTAAVELIRELVLGDEEQLVLLMHCGLLVRHLQR